MDVSVIIPVLNEKKALPATLASVHKQRGRFETIVVDGGSTDSTREIARDYAWIDLIRTDRGRAVQMNQGAARSSGEWLLFLHADTLLPDDAILTIAALTGISSVQTGCFRHRFSGRGWLLSAISWLHNWRFGRSRIIYGDQALFVRKSLFEELGGYPPVSIMEDVRFSERLVKVTHPVMLEKTVITDSRKFVKRGVIRSFLEVAIILTCHQLKLPILARKFFAPIR